MIDTTVDLRVKLARIAKDLNIKSSHIDLQGSYQSLVQAARQDTGWCLLAETIHQEIHLMRDTMSRMSEILCKLSTALDQPRPIDVISHIRAVHNPDGDLFQDSSTEHRVPL